MFAACGRSHALTPARRPAINRNRPVAAWSESQPNTACAIGQPEGRGHDSAGRRDRHLVGGQRLARAELHGDQIGIDARRQRCSRHRDLRGQRRQPEQQRHAERHRRHQEELQHRQHERRPHISGNAELSQAKPHGKQRKRTGNAGQRVDQPHGKRRQREARHAPYQAKHDADDQRIFEDPPQEIANDFARPDRLALAAPEDAEQDDRGHDHGRHMHRDEQRQDLEPFLPEDAQHERNAEQDQVGEGGRDAADHAGLRVAPENACRDEVAGSPCDGHGGEIGRPQRPGGRAMEVRADHRAEQKQRHRDADREFGQRVSGFSLEIARQPGRDSRARQARRRRGRFRRAATSPA